MPCYGEREDGGGKCAKLILLLALVKFTILPVTTVVSKLFCLLSFVLLLL